DDESSLRNLNLAEEEVEKDVESVAGTLDDLEDLTKVQEQVNVLEHDIKAEDVDKVSNIFVKAQEQV
ncbi:hypothetical protein Tco_0592196, partial [Tanacetum coccineum]